MAIHRLLQVSAFGPEDIEKLSAAYEDALRMLEISDRAAKRIIEAAQTGVRDQIKLCMLAIKDLRVP